MKRRDKENTTMKKQRILVVRMPEHNNDYVTLFTTPRKAAEEITEILRDYGYYEEVENIETEIKKRIGTTYEYAYIYPTIDGEVLLTVQEKRID